MLASVQGVYRNGQIELTELPDRLVEKTQVIVTSLPTADIDLQDYGIDRVEALTLQASLTTFAEDWSRPEMAIYDRYDAAKSRL